MTEEKNYEPKPEVRAAGEGRAQGRNDEAENDFPPKIGKPAQRALAGAGFARLEQLTQVSEAELLKLHGMGPKALGQLREALAARGLSFAKASGDQ